jgi:hypothetical protein
MCLCVWCRRQTHALLRSMQKDQERWARDLLSFLTCTVLGLKEHEYAALEPLIVTVDTASGDGASAAADGNAGSGSSGGGGGGGTVKCTPLFAFVDQLQAELDRAGVGHHLPGAGAAGARCVVVTKRKGLTD